MCQYLKKCCASKTYGGYDWVLVGDTVRRIRATVSFCEHRGTVRRLHNKIPLIS